MIDRRVARTRTALYDALVALIMRKTYESISIQDILDEANVGRSTFYSHFTSKDELLERSLERLHALLIAARDRHLTEAPVSERDPRTFSLAFFEHVAEHKAIHFAVVGGRAGEIIHNAITEVLSDLLRRTLPAKSPSATPRELVIRHVVATFVTVMHWWLHRRPNLSPAEVDELFRRLIQDGIGADWLDREQRSARRRQGHAGR